jgi:hypothetical protein
MGDIKFAGLVCGLAIACVAASSARSQEAFGDAPAITQFQRSVDAYTFQHRQVQRRLGEGADQSLMAAGMHAARPSAADGDFFTPIVAAAFRNRIAVALRAPECKITASGTSSEVPRVGALTIGTAPVPACVLKVLPHLPEELEYRAASVVLLLVDTHANMVVDVLHGAFPAPE